MKDETPVYYQEMKVQPIEVIRGNQGGEMTGWVDEYVTMLKDCEKRSEWLTEWESGFVNSLRRQIAEGRQPSAKQIEKLDGVWERVTAMRPRTAATNYG